MWYEKGDRGCLGQDDIREPDLFTGLTISVSKFWLKMYLFTHLVPNHNKNRTRKSRTKQNKTVKSSNHTKTARENGQQESNPTNFLSYNMNINTSNFFNLHETTNNLSFM